MARFFRTFDFISLSFASWAIQSALRPQRLEPVHRQVQAQAKMQRQDSREKLYQTVRETMNQAGIVSAAYKFKVLCIDGKKPAFILLIEIGTSAAAHSTDSLQKIETVIAQRARRQHGIKVPSVFWRHSDTAQIGPKAPLSQTVAAAAGQREASMALKDMVSKQKALTGAAAHLRAHTPAQPSMSRRVSHNGANIEDFGDTEELNLEPIAALSPTQYGDL